MATKVRSKKYCSIKGLVPLKAVVQQNKEKRDQLLQEAEHVC